jgi:hypothetical protein
MGPSARSVCPPVRPAFVSEGLHPIPGLLEYLGLCMRVDFEADVVAEG